jgi:hypothetical protein
LSSLKRAAREKLDTTTPSLPTRLLGDAERYSGLRYCTLFAVAAAALAAAVAPPGNAALPTLLAEEGDTRAALRPRARDADDWVW